MNVTKSLASLASKLTAARIKKDRLLMNNLDSGLDVEGTFFLVETDIRQGQISSEISDFVKAATGLVIPYSGRMLIVLSESLKCQNAKAVEMEVVDYLATKAVTYAKEHGEVLFGAFFSDQPIVAGGLLNKLLFSLLKRTDAG